MECRYDYDSKVGMDPIALSFTVANGAKFILLHDPIHGAQGQVELAIHNHFLQVIAIGWLNPTIETCGCFAEVLTRQVLELTLLTVVNYKAFPMSWRTGRHHTSPADSGRPIFSSTVAKIRQTREEHITWAICKLLEMDGTKGKMRDDMWVL